MEAADRHAKLLKGAETAVKKVSLTPRHRSTTQSTSKTSEACYRCGRTNHEPKDCRFRDAICNTCGKRGHISPVCRSKKSNKHAHKHSDARQSTQRTKWVTADVDCEDRETASDSNDLKLFMIGEKSSPPIEVEVQIDGQPLHMEVDTGAAVSIVSEETVKRLFPTASLNKSSVTLRTYTEERMRVCGEFQAQVRYGTQERSLTVVVVSGAGPSLFGRNWLKHLRLDWQKISSISAVPGPPKRLESLLNQHSEVFRDELGTVRSFEAKLQVRPDAKPKFWKARAVPFSIKEAIDQELERLESCGILQPVAYSEWAAPIVVVPKKDGRFRVCGDYKVTVNSALDVNQYPLPKPDDLFATLSGGQKFTKLDLSQAYQQIKLSEGSRPYLTVNTHRGLYQYTRLPFGVALPLQFFNKLWIHFSKASPTFCVILMTY